MRRIKKRNDQDIDRKEFLDEGEINRLLAACDDRLRPLVTVALGTGLRCGELQRLHWVDVHLDADAPHIVVRDKRDRVRYVPLGGMTIEVLHNLPHTQMDDLVFGEFTQRRFKETAVKAGLRHLGFHDLRMVFAQRLIERGADITMVSHILGHHQPLLFKRYSLDGATGKPLPEKVKPPLKPKKKKR